MKVIKLLILLSVFVFSETSECSITKSKLNIALSTMDKASLVGDVRLEQLYVQKAILAVLLKQEACKTNNNKKD